MDLSGRIDLLAARVSAAVKALTPDDEGAAPAVIYRDGPGSLRWTAGSAVIARALGWKIATDPTYGADPTGAVDATAALQACLDAAAADGTGAYLAGKFTTTGTVTITSDCDAHLATVTYSGTGIAVRAGSGSVLFRKTISLPQVINAGKTGAGWKAGTIGVQLLNVNSCPSITLARIYGFAVGLNVRGEGQGSVYNTINVGHLDNNQINHLCDANSTGWSNQNTYVGGRYSYQSAEGTGVAGAAQIVCADNPTNPINNNVWINPSLEGSIPEFMIDVRGGSSNLWIAPRLESGSIGGRIRWGANAVGNTVVEGYGTSSSLLNITRVAGESRNVIKSTNRFECYGSSTAGVLRLQNVSGATAPAVTMFGASSVADPDWVWQWSANTMQGKRVGDVSPRIILDATAGKISMGVGTADPTVALSVAGANLRIDTPTSTTAPAAGAAAALPATPAGYMSVYVGGAVRKIPYY